MGTMTLPAENAMSLVAVKRECGMPFTVTVPKAKSPGTRKALLLRLTDVPLIQSRQANLAVREFRNLWMLPHSRKTLYR